MNTKADFFFEPGPWQAEYLELRRMLQKTDLEETVKWGVPCYTLDGKNVVLMHGFKTYCALLFHKGVLLKDPALLLVQQTENVQSARQIRFTSLEQIQDLEPAIMDYLNEAIRTERSGARVSLKATNEFTMPEEFRERLETNPALKTAFESLTPGRQRAYLLHFAQPKQAKTRVSRIEKEIEQIMNGKGLND